MNIKKVYLQIIDSKTGIYQTGGIEEPVVSSKEIDNALGYFGIRYGDVDWKVCTNSEFVAKIGIVRDTTKIVSLVCVGQLI